MRPARALAVTRDVTDAPRLAGSRAQVAEMQKVAYGFEVWYGDCEEPRREVMILTLWVIPLTALAGATMHLMNRWRSLAPRESLGAPVLAGPDAGPGQRSRRLRRSGSGNTSSGGEGDPTETPKAADLSDLIENPPLQENVEQLCREARIRKLSVFLTTPGPLSRPEESLKVLVEFERRDLVDYPAFLRLQRGLSALVGRTVDLYARGKATPNPLPEPPPPARVLYPVPS